jgi:hypothetical protein
MAKPRNLGAPSGRSELFAVGFAAMLGALSCRSAVCLVHAYIGWAIVGGWAAVFSWGLAAFIVKREPNHWFWRLLGILQGVLILQLAVGLILLATGHRQEILHYAYGALFPAIVLTIAHVFARGMDEEKDTWKVFAVASFFVFGLTLRALTTGLGLP